MIDEYAKEKIRPLSFKEEMSSFSGRIIFIIATLWMIFSGIIVFFHIFGKAKINEFLMIVCLFSFIGGISFIIKQIFKDKNSKSKK